ncbi:hypothetical protein ACIBF1_08100 [Spirillospora sp. NPDC050679]
MGSRVYGPSRGPGAMLFWGVLLPAVAVVGVFWFGREVVPSVSAVVEAGERGTFTAARQDCAGRGPCIWTGDWVSDAGTRSRKNVRLLGDDVRVDAVGERVDALDSGGSTGVYADRYIGNTLWIIAFTAGALALLVFSMRVTWRLCKEHLAVRAWKRSSGGSAPLR